MHQDLRKFYTSNSLRIIQRVITPKTILSPLAKTEGHSINPRFLVINQHPKTFTFSFLTRRKIQYAHIRNNKIKEI